MENPFQRKEIIQQIKKIYCLKEEEIKRRLDEFKHKWELGNEEEIFAELVFCILTPQSKARSCWASVENLFNKNLILEGNKNRLVKELGGVRFKQKKANYIIEARRWFSYNGKVSIRPKIGQFGDVYGVREWLVQNVKGVGYKEASHFLRNVGFGEEIAILDRHILKNLKLLGVIETIPTHLTKTRYFEIERKMKEFASRVNIPMSHLDLVLWCKETGEIFK